MVQDFLGVLWRRRSSSGSSADRQALLLLFVADCPDHRCTAAHRLVRVRTSPKGHSTSRRICTEITDLLLQVTLPPTAVQACYRHRARVFMPEGIPSCQELRFEAISLKKHHPDWSCRKIAKQIGCCHTTVSRWVARFAQCQQLEDSHRSGRPPKADAAAVQHIVKTAQLAECRTAAAIASRLQQEIGLNCSPSTVRTVLKKNGLQHMGPKAVPVLSARHKRERVRDLPRDTSEGTEHLSGASFAPTARSFCCRKWADLLTDGAFQQQEGLFQSTSTASKPTYTWESAIGVPPSSCLSLEPTSILTNTGTARRVSTMLA